ncbi:unnamed protein product [Brassica rapa subsp. trilocularis]
MDSLQWSIQMRKLNVVTKNFMKMFIRSSRSMENSLISRSGDYFLLPRSAFLFSASLHFILNLNVRKCICTLQSTGIIYSCLPVH